MVYLKKEKHTHTHPYIWSVRHVVTLDTVTPWVLGPCWAAQSFGAGCDTESLVKRQTRGATVVFAVFGRGYIIAASHKLWPKDLGRRSLNTSVRNPSKPISKPKL